jgi:hypothetical protein
MQRGVGSDARPAVTPWSLLAGLVAARRLVIEASNASAIHDRFDPLARSRHANFHLAFAKMRNMDTAGVVLRHRRRSQGRSDRTDSDGGKALQDDSPRYGS